MVKSRGVDTTGIAGSLFRKTLTASCLSLTSVLALSACAIAPPEGPQVMAMPGAGKTFAEFEEDNARCQESGARAAGPLTPAQGAAQSGVGTAAAGTVIGAAAGALLGAVSGSAGAGAAIGAGTGLLAGSVIGFGAAQQSSAALQRAYDITYVQCMSAAGEKVPDLSTMPTEYPTDAYPAYRYAPPAYGYDYPPPYYQNYGPPVFYDPGWGWRRRW